MRVRIAQELGASLFEIETANELKDALKRASQRMGFDHFALSLEARTSDDADAQMLLHDYPAEWAKVYTSFDLAGRDPVRRACDKAFGGFTWEGIGQLIPMTRGDRQMLAVGKECGIGDGFTIPRHLPSMARGTFTFAVAPDRSLPHRWLTTALKISGMARTVALPRLSDRQRECLLWVARGKTAAETAIILGISTETVIQHLKMARERYEVHCSQSLSV
jgi:LuxR family quorum-sensing system transcriptional regulator CciR